MPTPKQTRDAIKRIRYCTHKLQSALNHAHNIKVIDYDPSTYMEDSPCKALEELRERVRRTTKEQVYTAFIDEIKQSEW